MSGLALIVAGTGLLFASVLAGVDQRQVGFLCLLFACVMCLPMIPIALLIGGSFAL